MFSNFMVQRSTSRGALLPIACLLAAWLNGAFASFNSTIVDGINMETFQQIYHDSAFRQISPRPH